MNLLFKPIEGGFNTFRATCKLNCQGIDGDRNCLTGGASSLLQNRKVKDINYPSLQSDPAYLKK
jgi:hypothetical protein